jgi:hypothetical protein
MLFFNVNRQVRRWMDTVANVRVHQTTLQLPRDRFEGIDLRLLPELLPDCRETGTLKVYNDFAVRFDGNTYTTPPWAIGKHVTVKADRQTLTIFYQHKKLATHERCWQRGQRVETPFHKEQVRKLQRRLWLDKDIAAFSFLGKEAVTYLQALSQARQPIKKNVSKLLSLKDDYGTTSIIYAGSNLFFQVISARHEKRPTIITTNRPFAQWGEVFDNTTVATAIADRLVYNSEVLIMEGPSYRKRMKNQAE